MIKVALLVNDTLIRKSLLSLLNSFQGINVEFDTECINKFIHSDIGKNLDVIIFKIKQINNDTIQQCQRLKNLFPEAKTLVLTNEIDGQGISKLINVGINGCFSSKEDPVFLREALLARADERFQYDSHVAQYIQDAFLSDLTIKKNEHKMVLTERELQIIKLACVGLSSLEIASELFISVRTVETHRKRIISKTNTKNFIGVILYALKNDMFTVEEVS